MRRPYSLSYENTVGIELISIVVQEGQSEKDLICYLHKCVPGEEKCTSFLANIIITAAIYAIKANQIVLKYPRRHTHYLDNNFPVRI